jgi:hypothetical protein
MKYDMKNKTYQSILPICIGFLALYLLWQWQWALYTSFGVGIISILSPFLAKKIIAGWELLALGLSYIMPNILLTIIYFLLLTPLALLARAFRKNPPIPHKNPTKSNFKIVEKDFSPSSLENPW